MKDSVSGWPRFKDMKVKQSWLILHEMYIQLRKSKQNWHDNDSNNLKLIPWFKTVLPLLTVPVHW